MVWLEPGTHENVCVVLYGAPSTMNARPAGLVWTTTWTLVVGVGVAVGVAVAPAVAVAVAVAIGVAVAVAVAVEIAVAVGVGVKVTVAVAVDVAVAVAVVVGVAVAVGVAVGVGLGAVVKVPTTRYFELLGMPLVKTVTKAGPEGKSFTGIEVKEVSDQPAVGSIGRDATWLLSILRSCTTG
jgi:hypothetical protein